MSNKEKDTEMANQTDQDRGIAAAGAIVVGTVLGVLLARRLARRASRRRAERS